MSSPTPKLACFLVVFVAACSANAPAPVEDRRARQPAKVPVIATQSSSAYRVARGDTLYSIAFRYGLDFRRLAAANRIPAPYTIYPGQALVLRESAVIPASKPKPPTRKKAAVPGKPKPALPKPPAAAAPPGRPPASKPQPLATPSPNAKASGTFVGAAVKRWRWPSSGKVVRRFSHTVHKGIDLAGQRGDSVHAVAAGKVVYAGTGILGLGELLIIKHNDVYLSAYGHNDSLLVAEGELVEVGQTIARKGSTGTDTVKLHFEIRKAGKPIDPQRLLPKR